MSEKERVISAFTAAPRTVLLSETTGRLKLEKPDAMSQPKVVQRTVEMPQVQFINRVVRISVAATEAGTLTQCKLCRRLWRSHMCSSWTRVWTSTRLVK